MRASPRHANEFLRATADVHDALRHTKTTKMRLGSDVPPGLGLILFGYSQGSAALHPGLFSCVPSGNFAVRFADVAEFSGRRSWHVAQRADHENEAAQIRSGLLVF